jgi:hypothetical protein
MRQVFLCVKLRTAGTASRRVRDVNMAKLDPEVCMLVAILWSEYGKVLCEAEAAKVMLKGSADQRIPIPVLWEEVLKTVKARPDLASLAQHFEMSALTLEKGALETEAIELLKKVPIKTRILS